LIYKSISGFTLTEVIISLFLFSIFSLTINSVQALAVKNTLENFYDQLAIQQVKNMVERVQVANNFNGLDSQIRVWNKENSILFSNSKGEVQRNHQSYIITLTYMNQKQIKAIVSI